MEMEMETRNAQEARKQEQISASYGSEEKYGPEDAQRRLSRRCRLLASDPSQ